MNLYNRNEQKRKVLSELDEIISKIPAEDKEASHVTLSYIEFILAKEALGWKTGLFRPWPKYKGVTIISAGMAK